jgi:hypothetical protein
MLKAATVFCLVQPWNAERKAARNRKVPVDAFGSLAEGITLGEVQMAVMLAATTRF